jgi:hypothetical protein
MLIDPTYRPGSFRETFPQPAVNAKKIGGPFGFQRKLGMLGARDRIKFDGFFPFLLHVLFELRILWRQARAILCLALRNSQKPNVTETYLNLENVKIERKKTGHKAACMSPGKWEVGRKLSQRCITWLV